MAAPEKELWPLPCCQSVVAVTVTEMGWVMVGVTVILTVMGMVIHRLSYTALVTGMGTGLVI